MAKCKNKSIGKIEEPYIIPLDKQEGKTIDNHVYKCLDFNSPITLKSCYYRRLYQSCKRAEDCDTTKVLKEKLPIIYGEGLSYDINRSQGND